MWCCAPVRRGRAIHDRNAACGRREDSAGHQADTAFAAMQARGQIFARPFEVHAQVVPGTSVMAARRTKITYEPSDRPRGAEVRIRTTDPAAVAAIHAFLAFQRTAHHVVGHEAMPSGVH